MVTSLNIQLMYLGITMAFKMLNQFQVSSDISPSTGWMNESMSRGEKSFPGKLIL